MAKKPTAAEAADTPPAAAPSGDAAVAPAEAPAAPDVAQVTHFDPVVDPVDPAPPAAPVPAEMPAAPEIVAAMQEMVNQVATDTAAAPIIPVPTKLDFMVKAKVLDSLVHDGVTYAEGSVVSLTPDQHRDLVRAGVVSDQPVEALPY